MISLGKLRVIAYNYPVALTKHTKLTLHSVIRVTRRIRYGAILFWRVQISVYLSWFLQNCQRINMQKNCGLILEWFSIRKKFTVFIVTIRREGGEVRKRKILIFPAVRTFCIFSMWLFLATDYFTTFLSSVRGIRLSETTFPFIRTDSAINSESMFYLHSAQRLFLSLTFECGLQKSLIQELVSYRNPIPNIKIWKGRSMKFSLMI